MPKKYSAVGAPDAVDAPVKPNCAAGLRCRAICAHLLQQPVCAAGHLLPAVPGGGQEHQDPALCPLQLHAGRP